MPADRIQCHAFLSDHGTGSRVDRGGNGTVARNEPTASRKIGPRKGANATAGLDLAHRQRFQQSMWSRRSLPVVQDLRAMWSDRKPENRPAWLSVLRAPGTR